MTPQTEMVVNILGFIIAVVGFLYVVVFSHKGIRDLQRLLPSVRIADAVQESTKEFVSRKNESDDNSLETGNRMPKNRAPETPSKEGGLKKANESERTNPNEIQELEKVP